MIVKHNNNTIDSFLNDIFFINNHSFPLKSECSYSSNSNLEKLKDKYVFKTVATGLDTDDLTIDIQDNSLLITSKTNEKDNFTFDLNQKIKLKEKVDTSNITAKLEKGILEISVPFDTSGKTKCNVTFI